MMLKLKLIVILALAVVGLVLVFSDANAVVCTVTEAKWNKNTVRVGENIGMEVTVQNAAGCANQNIGVQVFDDDTFGDDSIAGPFVKIFTGTSNKITYDYTFTIQDWEKGGSENPETIYFSALPQNQSVPKYSNYIFFSPASAGSGGTTITNFNVNRIGQGQIRFTFLASIPRPAELKSLCGSDPFWAVREVNSTDRSVIKLVRNGQFVLDKTNYKFDFDEPGQVNGKTYEGAIICQPNTVTRSQLISCDSSGVCRPVSGGGITCNNNRICDAGETSATCSDCPVTPGSTQNIPFSIPNPLQANNLIELIDVLATWLFNLAIPVVVIMIIYAGVMFLTSRGDTAKVTKARQILLYAVVGFAIILIGKGFITLIESVLNLGAGS